METKSIDQKIKELEEKMSSADFWEDKDRAQHAIKELNELKQKKEAQAAVLRGDAIMTILSGAGGDDAEDFSRMLLEMYLKFIQKKGWSVSFLHENKNDHGGYRNITIEIGGKGAYGTLKNESGVHRLVRVSPFSAKSLRHTSFSMVEVLPKIPKTVAIDIPESDLKVELSKAGGPGGQNVNKRETAVRIVHMPTNISVHVTSERSQAQNKEKALEILKAKLFKKAEDEKKELRESMQISKTTDIEWGNQIRSYVLHPYKMVKDHRTDTEVRDVESVLERGNIEPFIEAERDL